MAKEGSRKQRLCQNMQINMIFSWCVHSNIRHRHSKTRNLSLTFALSSFYFIVSFQFFNQHVNSGKFKPVENDYGWNILDSDIETHNIQFDSRKIREKGKSLFVFFLRSSYFISLNSELFRFCSHHFFFFC